MRRFIVLLGVLGLVSFAAAHPPNVDFYVVPDVPTDLPLSSPPETTALTWRVLLHDAVNPYTSTVSPPLALPVTAAIDALHLETSGDWLFSLAAPTDLGGATYLPHDVVRYDGASYSLFFCGGPFGLASGANVDAVLLTNQRDDGNLVISFDAPTDIGGTTYLPADLVELMSTGVGCGSWAVVGYFFDSATAFAVTGAGQLPPVPNVIAADERGPLTLLSFATPTELSGTTYRPGELVSWDAGVPAFALYHSDAAWPVTGRTNALALLAAPGTIPNTGTNIKLELQKGPGAGQVTLTWSQSCSVGATDYGFYEGFLPALASAWTYNHGQVGCSDTGAAFTEVIGYAAGNTYYLVVPNNTNDEGSYGKDSPASAAPSERPVGSPACRTTQEVGCP